MSLASTMSFDNQQSNIVQSLLVGATNLAIDQVVYAQQGSTPSVPAVPGTPAPKGGDMMMIFAQSAGAEYLSENVNQMLFSDMKGQAQITGPISSGLVYVALNAALQNDRKPFLTAFLTQVGASAVGRYVSPMLRPDEVQPVPSLQPASSYAHPVNRRVPTSHTMLPQRYPMYTR